MEWICFNLKLIPWGLRYYIADNTADKDNLVLLMSGAPLFVSFERDLKHQIVSEEFIKSFVTKISWYCAILLVLWPSSLNNLSWWLLQLTYCYKRGICVVQQYMFCVHCTLMQTAVIEFCPVANLSRAFLTSITNTTLTNCQTSLKCP